MMEITAQIIHIDYDSVVQAAIPLLKQNPNALGTNRIVKGIMKKLLASPAHISTVASLIPNDFKDDLFVFVVFYYKDSIKNKLQEIIAQKNIGISIQKIVLQKIGNGTVALKIYVHHIDYIKVIASILPFLHFNTAENEIAPFLNEIIRVLKEVPAATDIIVTNISQEIKDKMAVFLIARYEEYICSALQTVAEQSGIKITVQKLIIACITEKPQ